MEFEMHDRGKNSDGIYLTWTDIWVTVPVKKTAKVVVEDEGRRLSILHGVTGYAEPGEVVAIMGPSGCGKSTLLDCLAGRLHLNTNQTGDILVNGKKQALAYGTSAYVTQDDTLMATLTVREAVYYSALLQLPKTMLKSEKKERAEETIREMGLSSAIDTKIGGWNVKGLSGGQKRRVSICIEILTRPKLLFLDEPTSGLDSAASYHVMKRITELARQERTTVIFSIHQPSGDVFELFSSLCLLSAGKTIYFGPASATNEFFASSGFPCPSLMNPSDHFLKTINKDFDVDIEQGVEKITADEAIGILAEAYKVSDTYEQAKKRVEDICIENRELTLSSKETGAGFIQQTFVLTKRSFVNMYRDLGYYWLRLGVYITLCLCLGTVFYHLGDSYASIQSRQSLLLFVSGFLTFMAIGGFPSFVEELKIFKRERLNGHYSVTAYVIGNTISSTPYLLLNTIIPATIAYYLADLQKSIDHFAYYTLVLFSCMMLVESLMMIVAVIVPNFLMGIITGAGIQGIMLLIGGYFCFPNDIPKPVWKYPIFYIAFHTHANQGLLKNEFKGLVFQNNVPGGPSTVSGDEILSSIWQVNNYSKWIDAAILLGMVVTYRMIFLGTIKLNEKIRPLIRECFSS